MAQLVIFNKPYRVLSQFTDPTTGEPDNDAQRQRATLADFIPLKGVYVAGRLDYDSEGLMLLTDDGQLQHQISHPNHKLSKTYWVQVEGSPKEDALQQLRDGITLADGPCRPALVNRLDEPAIWPRQPPIRHRDNIPTSWLEITITEGRNRQIRRMTSAIGHPTLRLIRTRIGSWTLEDLLPGEYQLTKVHVARASTKQHRGRRGSYNGKGRQLKRKPR